MIAHMEKTPSLRASIEPDDRHVILTSDRAIPGWTIDRDDGQSWRWRPIDCGDRDTAVAVASAINRTHPAGWAEISPGDRVPGHPHQPNPSGNAEITRAPRA